MNIFIKGIRYFIDFLIFLSFCSIFSQELHIEGSVRDTLKNPLPDVSVIVYQNGKVIAYTFTNEDGRYSFNLAKGLSDLKITASLLGFQAWEKEMPVNSENIADFDIVLEPKEEMLQEVVLESWEKIKVKRDTITFKVSEFSDKTENVVEDLLKNIPGVEISTEGVIKVNGQAIDKLLVEGDDMFGRKYKLLSKNLDADAIDQVQILNNFEDNPVLKSFQDSKKVALNLILKEDKKNIWFGNVELGIGTNGQQNHSGNIGLIRKETKFFDFINTNNIGNSASSQVNNSSTIEISNLNDAEMERRANYTPVNVDNLSNTNFSNGEDIFNDSFINSLSILKNISQGTKLRNLTYYAYDDISKRNTNLTEFFLNPETISFFEKNDIGILNNYFSTQLEIRHTNEDKLFLNFDTSFENIPGRKRNLLNFNDEQIHQNQTDNQINFFNKLNLTKRILSNRLLSVLAYYGSNDTRQTLNIKPNIFSDIFDNDANLPIRQRSKTPQDFYGISSEILNKNKKSQYSLKLSADVEYDDLQSKFEFLGGGGVDTLSNNTDFKQSKFGLTSKYNIDIAKKFSLNSTLNLSQNRLQLNNQVHNFTLMDVKVGLNSKRTMFGNFGINYNFSNNLPPIEVLNENFFLRDYRFFSKGISDIQSFKNHSIAFFYTFNDYKKQFLVNSFLIHSFFNNSYGSTTKVNERTNFSNKTILGGGESTNFSLSINRYIRLFETSVKLSTQHLWFNNQTIINDQVGNLSNYNGNVKLQGTTYFGIPLNFKFYAMLNYSEGTFANQKSSTNYLESSFQAVLKFSDEWYIDFETRYYDFETSNFTFSDFSLHYTPADSRWSFKTTANNIWNVKKFSNISITEFQRNELFARAIQRYFMLSVKYRF